MLLRTASEPVAANNSTRSATATTDASPAGPTRSSNSPTRCCVPRERSPDLAHLSLEPEHHRGHGALYDAINHGRIDHDALKTRIGAVPVAKIPGPDGRERIVLAVDVSNWLRPDAACSPERAFCHPYARNGQAQMVPGWPYSFIAALESGATSWTALLDVVRLRPGGDATAATATQLREVADRLIATGQQQADGPEILVVMDAGYDVIRLAWLLRDLPMALVARIRSDRVFYALRRGTPRPDHGPPTAPRGQTGAARSGHAPGTGVHHGA